MSTSTLTRRVSPAPRHPFPSQSGAPKRPAAGSLPAPTYPQVGSCPISARSSDQEIFVRMHADQTMAPRCRELLVERYRSLATGCARRYSSRGETDDDLRQVAFVGLLASIHRFDPARSNDFAAFARPTVLGELRRHFRDGRRWVRVPRRLQELAGEARQVTEETAQRLNRMPSRSDLATVLGADERELAAALEADQFFAPASLDAPVGTDESETATRGELVGSLDGDLERVTDLTALRPMIDDLPDRERTIVMMTFYGNHTQVEIGDHLGISQMHVSRLLSRTLEQLRDRLEQD